jgi:hypothetical protein
MLAGPEKEVAAKAAGDKSMMTREEQTALLKAASVIEKLGKEREMLIDALAKAMHEKNAVKLAYEMAEKGLIAQEDLTKKAEELTKEEDLSVVKKAVDLSQRGFELGKLEKRASVDGVQDGEELDPLTQCLVDHINGRGN